MATGTSDASPVQSADVLLPPRALNGQRIGISVSDSTDLPRLGLTPSHFQLAVRELALAVLVGGGKLAYGGHLVPGGCTELLIQALNQYARGAHFRRLVNPSEVPLIVCLGHAEHRHSSLQLLDDTDQMLGTYGELRCLTLDGQEIAQREQDRGEAGEPYPNDPAELAQGLTSLRCYLTDHVSARMLLGGKRHGYKGAMPGVIEEALMALNRQQPLYLAAGFGGATLDMATTIDARCAAIGPRHPGDPPLDDATNAALQQVRAAVGTDGWAALRNGLTEDENLQLAMTHRPSELAAWITLGTGRLGKA